eukprot:3229552-Rhodomonas_salina.8
MRQHYPKDRDTRRHIPGREHIRGVSDLQRAIDAVCAANPPRSEIKNNNDNSCKFYREFRCVYRCTRQQTQGQTRACRSKREHCEIDRIPGTICTETVVLPPPPFAISVVHITGLAGAISAPVSRISHPLRSRVPDQLTACATPRNQIRRTTVSVQIVPGMRSIVFDFAVFAFALSSAHRHSTRAHARAQHHPPPPTTFSIAAPHTAQQNKTQGKKKRRKKKKKKKKKKNGPSQR